MSIDDLSKIPLWMRDVSMDERRVNHLDVVVPMPEFGTIKSSQFEKIDPKHPNRLVKDVLERFPFSAAMPTEHPSFKVALAAMTQNPIANMSPIDWAWHREILKRSREREEVRRVFNRFDFENYQAELHREQEIRRELDKRAFHFGEAIKNKLELAYNIERGVEISTKQQKRMQEWGLKIQDKNKQNAFLMLYLKHFSPSRERVKLKTKELMTTETYTQYKAAQKFEKSPFELFIEEVYRLIPILRKEEIRAAFTSWETHLNNIRTEHLRIANFRRTVAKMFAQIFIYDSERGFFAQRKENINLYNASVYDQMNIEKKDQAVALNKELANDHLRELEHNRADFERFIDKLNFNRLVTKIYDERELNHRRHRAHMDSETQVSYKGVTDWVQVDPVKNKTQFSIIRKWINNVEMLREQQSRNYAEVVDTMQENNRQRAEEINLHSLEGAVEYGRVIDVMRMRELQQTHTLDQIVDMFAATAMAANMLTGYHTNVPPSHAAPPGEQANPNGIVSEILRATAPAKLTG